MLALLVSGCGATAGIEIREARIPEPAGPNAVLYLTAVNRQDTTDRLVGVTTTVARAEIHESRMEQGLMTMRPVEGGLEVPSGGTLTLAPGGYHVMLLDPPPLQQGDVVRVTLRWSGYGDMTIDVPVVDAGGATRLQPTAAVPPSSRAA